MQSNNKLTETLIALMGIWLVVSPIPDFITNVFAYMNTDFGDAGNQLHYLPIIHLLIKLLCGFGLIVFRNKIVSSLGLGISTPSDCRNLLSASIFLLGIYFILNGCIAIGQFYMQEQSGNLNNPSMLWQGIFTLISGTIAAIFSTSFGKYWWLLKRP